MPPITLITHIWNEAFLLPYFIQHYLPLVDRAVVVDYASVDGSTDIVRQLAPEWEIRQSRNRYFGAQANADEIKDIESEFDGWKFVANATEFLIHEDLRAFLRESRQDAVWAFDMCMFEPPREAAKPITPEPLYVQRRYGFHSDDNHRGRMIHREKHGHFTCAGRHLSSLADRGRPEEALFVAWFCWSPVRYLWHRRLAASTMAPAEDKANGIGVWACGVFHRDWYLEQVSRSYDLWERFPAYSAAIESIKSAT